MQEKERERWRAAVRLRRAVDRWAGDLIVFPGDAFTESRYGFEWVTVPDPLWCHRRWRHGVVTSSIREGSNEGHIIDVLVDGHVVVHAKCLYHEELYVHETVGALLVRAFQSRVARVMRRNAVELEEFDRETAALVERNREAWIAKNGPPERGCLWFREPKDSASVDALARKEVP